MKTIGISALILAVSLAGCASQPTLSHNEIDRVHSVKVVYIRAPDALGIYAYYPTGGGIMPVPTGGGTLFLPTPTVDMNGSKFVTEQYLSSTFQSELTSLDTRPRLLAAATQAISQVSWLAKAPLSVIDHPMDDDAMLRDAQDSNLDAVIYLKPRVEMEYLGRYLHLGIDVTVYVNPRTKSAYRYDTAMIGSDQEIQLKQDPNKPHQSISARSPKELAAVWFSDDAAQLRGDIELELPQIEPDLVHYLGGDAPAKAN